jgi:hypothetical protein
VSRILQPGAGIIFMKVGTHAQESLDDIIARKRKEIADAGYSLWGYGGGTCHPQTMVQPFAKTFTRNGSAIYLCMEEMESRHFAEPKRAEQSSSDGLNWEDIPKGVNVLGSRYALVVKEFRSETFDLALAGTKVAIGNSQGRAGHLYVRGRVDKACLEVVGDAGATEGNDGGTRIGLVAELAAPYALFLRNRPG